MHTHIQLLINLLRLTLLKISISPVHRPALFSFGVLHATKNGTGLGTRLQHLGEHCRGQQVLPWLGALAFCFLRRSFITERMPARYHAGFLSFFGGGMFCPPLEISNPDPPKWCTAARYSIPPQTFSMFCFAPPCDIFCRLFPTSHHKYLIACSTQNTVGKACEIWSRVVTPVRQVVDT